MQKVSLPFLPVGYKGECMKGLEENLNAEQRSAVEHAEGPLLIIAGAGTGKTKVITHRIARLVEAGCDPSRILALTFTEKAAGEMEERVDRLVPYGYSNVWISTFHSFGERVLRDNALSIGLNPDFKLLTESESIIFLKEHLFDLPIRRYRPAGDPSRYLSALIRFFGRLKDEDTTPEEFLRYSEKLKKDGPGEGEEAEAFGDFLEETTELAATYSKYSELMYGSGYLDFGDLVVLALKLFRIRPNILKRYRERFLHILTDEFQDTNYAQFELLKLLAGEKGNITVVADDDQSIYKFRGAAVSNVINFLNAFPGHRLVTLKENYRSVQPILDAAYRLITNNNPDRLEIKSGIDKRLKSTRPLTDECGVRHIHFDTVSNEAAFVADTIDKRVKEGSARYRDFAVLVRARNDAVPFLDALDAKGIPYHYSGNSGLFAREEIVLLICFLKVVTDFSDSISLSHLASSFIYGLKAEDLVPCNNLSKRTNSALFYVMRDLAAGKKDAASLNISQEGLDIIKRIVEDMLRYSQMAVDEPSGRVIYSFLTESGYIPRLVQEGTERAEETVRNIARFFEITAHMEETLFIRKASTLVGELNLLMEAGDNPGVAEPDPDCDAVQVLTVHKAKGLEFPAVFMVNLVSERFPRRERKDPIELPEELIKDMLPSGDFHLQEERRLFYVGMTRAENELFLTSASDCGGVRSKKVSRFVLEALDTPKAAPVKASPMERIATLAGGSGGPAPSSRTEGRPGGLVLTPVPEDTELHLSYYQIDDYLTCPLKYKYVHILKVPLLPHHTVIYGKAVHDAVSFYFRRRLEGIDTSIEELLAVFKSSWNGAGFVSKEHEVQRFNSGIDALKRFYEEAFKVVPRAVEKDFSVAMGNNLLRGRWDLIVERDDGPYIVDFKTSEVRQQDKADKKAKESVQLMLYTLAYKEVFKKLPAGCELHFVDSGLTGSAAFREKDLEKTTARVFDVASGIRRRDFTARPDYLSCSWCAFNNICPYKQKNVTSGA